MAKSHLRWHKASNSTKRRVDRLAQCRNLDMLPSDVRYKILSGRVGFGALATVK